MTGPSGDGAATIALPTAPAYGSGTLADLLPAVARSLGVSAPAGSDPDSRAVTAAPQLPPSRRALVMLVDGMGERLLRARSGHAPTLRSMLADPRSRTLTAGFPSTTATSLASFGTGSPPGSHGLVGYEVLDPSRDTLLNELSWDGAVDPRRWQPHATVFQHAAADGVEVTRIGPAFFDGSGLTEAALRGGRFTAAGTLSERVDAALAALRESPRALVYLYWGEVDRVGHERGCGSWQWGEELAAVDAAVERLIAGLPSDAALHVTADHGMVDVPHADRLDLANDPELAAGVRHAGGEPRALHLYTETGATDDVLATWRARLADRMWVLSRDEAIAAGWFGPVDASVRPRVGDVIAAARTSVAVVDSRRQRPEYVSLLGVHGSLTPDETQIPWLIATGSALD